MLTATSRSAEDINLQLKKLGHKNLGRRILFGTDEALPPLKICRWRAGADGIEVPPGPDCPATNLDIVLQASDPQSFDAAEYIRILDGNARRLHVCRRCSAGITVTNSGTEIRTDTSSIWAVWLLTLVKYNQHVQKRHKAAARELENSSRLFGDHYLHLAGFKMQSCCAPL